jgi:hypothetical protein
MASRMGVGMAFSVSVHRSGSTGPCFSFASPDLTSSELVWAANRVIPQNGISVTVRRFDGEGGDTSFRFSAEKAEDPPFVSSR